MTSTPSHNPGSEDIDLHRYVQIVWRRKWVLLLFVVLLPASAYLVSTRAAKSYQASAVIQVQPTGAAATTTTIDLGATTESLAQTVSLAQTISVTQLAAQQLPNPPRDPRDLERAVKLTTDATSGFVTITASAASGQRAANIANAYAAAIRATRTEQAQRQIDVTIAGTPGATAPASSSHGAPTALSLAVQQQLEQLRIARADQPNRTVVIEPAVVPGSPVSPKPLRTAGLALVIAIVLGIGLVFLLDGLDRRIREPDEIERLVRAPLLGAIPAAAFGEKPGAYAGEAFHMLRASLMYFNVDPLEVVVVASPIQGDGKTTVATHLSSALARSQRKVLLLDTDLRRSQADERLLGQHRAVGLGALLAGQATLDEVLLEVDPGGAPFDLLPAGDQPPNPSELLASERMKSLLAVLRDRYDLVVIDTAPLLAVSDVIPLLEQASGVIVVSKLRHTPRKSLVQLAGVVASARGSLLGSVVTGVREGRSSYGYRDGYGQRPPKAKPQPASTQKSNGEAGDVDQLTVTGARRSEDAQGEHQP